MTVAVEVLLFMRSDISGAVRRLLNDKVPSSDRVTSVMNSLYRTVEAWGVIPPDWNTAVIQLT